MSELKRLKTKNGEHQIWMALDEKGKAWTRVGDVKHRVCTVYKALGLQAKYEPYFGVHKCLLRQAKKLKIRKLRAQYVTYTEGKYGLVTKICYGYIERTEFKRLIKTRKNRIDSFNELIVLLKKEDMEFHSE